MADNRGDFVVPPWWKSGPEDYTKHRTGDIGYTMDDLIGRKDTNKFKLTTSTPLTTGVPAGDIIVS